MNIQKIYFLLLLALMCIYACIPKQEATKIKPLSNKFITLKLEPACKHDPLISEIKSELKDKNSVLHLMKFYAEQLEKNPIYLKKLERLFTCGKAKEAKGHFYGITLFLKKGEHPYGDFLNQIWGATLADVSPWDGKIFNPINNKNLEFYTEGFEKGEVPTYLGINCFRKYEGSLLNVASIVVLTFWMNLKEAPQEEKTTYGYDKKGGLFIARRAKSVASNSSEKEVFQLNYRWKRLGNPIPLKYLIDEIVEIADGLYLGQLLFATKHLLEDYDPQLEPSEYKYENFGYFLLMDEKWNEERKRLFLGG